MVVVPVTSNTARVYPAEAVITIAGHPSKAMADQIMTADKLRLKSSLGKLSPADMKAVEEAIRVHLGLIP